jgi:uncharacterized membrane protein YvbJ
MKFCSECGSQLLNNPKFCQQCGHALSGAAPASQRTQDNQKPPLSDLLIKGKTEGQSTENKVIWWILRIAVAAAFLAFIASRN